MLNNNALACWQLEIFLTELSLDILLFVIGKLNLAGPFSLRSSMILDNCCKVRFPFLYSSLSSLSGLNGRKIMWGLTSSLNSILYLMEEYFKLYQKLLLDGISVITIPCIARFIISKSFH